MVEGHHVGDARRASASRPTRGAEGADAQALRAAAQKALASEIERARRAARARRRRRASCSPSDGHLRWRGEPVARLAAGEDAAEAALRSSSPTSSSPARRASGGGASRRWLAQHIETLLKPLIDLARPTGLAGMARGIAFRLVENFGVHRAPRGRRGGARRSTRTARAGMRAPRRAVRRLSHLRSCPAEAGAERAAGACSGR